MVPTTRRLHQRDAERREDQNEAHEQAERNRVAHRRQPGCSDGTDQKISSGENQIGDGKRAAKSHAVGGGPAEDGQKPNHPTENAGQRSRLLGGEIQLLLQVQRQRRERSIVGEAFKNFSDIGHPEWPLEAGADFAEALGNFNWAPGLVRIPANASGS